jgi:hypothetical protein
MKRTRVLTRDDILSMERFARTNLIIARMVNALVSAIMSVTIGVGILVVTRDECATIILTLLAFIGLMIFMEKMIYSERREYENKKKLVNFMDSDEEEITIIE